MRDEELPAEESVVRPEETPHFRGTWSPNLPNGVDFNQHGYAPVVPVPTYYIAGLGEVISADESEKEDAIERTKSCLKRNGTVKINPNVNPLIRAVFDHDVDKTQENLLPDYINAPENLKAYTPIILAAQTRNDALALELTSLLVDSGADRNSTANDGMNPLFSAVMVGNLETVKYLESKGVNLRQTQHRHWLSGKNATFITSTTGNLPMMQYLHSRGVEVDNYVEGNTPKDGHPYRLTSLFIASEKGELNMVKWLLDVGANPLSECSVRKEAIGITPIHQAAFTGRLEILQLYRDRGYPMDEPRGEIQVTPFHTACKGGHLSTVQYLLSCSIDLNRATTTGVTGLYFAVQEGHYEVAELLMQAGAPVGFSVPSLSNKTPLMAATLLHDDDVALKLVHALMQRGADPKKTGPEVSPLLFTALRGLPNTAKALLEAGADPYYRTEKTNCSVAYMAASNGNTNVLQVLYDFGVDIHKVVEYVPTGQKMTTHLTPLFVAAQNGHVETVRFLLNHGARVDHLCNVSDRNRQLSPLHQAALMGRTDVVQVFVEVRCNLNVTGLNTGDSPLSLAATHGRVEVVKVLLNGKADPNYIRVGDPAAATSLYMAAQRGHLEVVKLLLAANANPYHRTNVQYHMHVLGMTARHVAGRNNHREVEAYLAAFEKNHPPETCSIM